jgi:serine/threonine-protein kinase RsbT
VVDAAAPEEVHLSIASDADIVAARQLGRRLANRAGCTSTELTEIATAISELARNIVNYADSGQMALRLVSRDDRTGVRIVASDDGPGIEDVERAMQDGFTTGAGLGLGLPGTKRLMDDFVITSKVDEGTTVTVHKWATSR